MKKLKISFFIALITLSSTALFFACSSDKEELQDLKSSSKTVSADKLAQTICDIIGTTVVSSGSAVVTPGSSATYSYTNNTGSATTITWTLTGVGATFSGGGTTITTTSPVTVVYSSNFVSGTLSAAGSGGTAQTCNTILNITTPTVTCCNPTFDAFYICDGTVQGKGAVVPFVQGCNVSTISKIVWNLGGAKWISGPLAGQGGGTMVPPFNQYVKNIGNYQCQYGMFRITATYYFNNGCPPSIYNLDVTPTN